MSLIGALNVGKSALAVHQAAIQVTSNNVANAGNPDYTRQVARITPAGQQQYRPGLYVGMGVNLSAVERQIDQALEDRIRGSFSDFESASARQQWLGRVESVFNELGDDDLSSGLSTFFNGWSNLANKPQDIGLRQVVIQNGESLAGTFRSMRGQLDSLQGDVDHRLTALADDVDALAGQVAELNGQIVSAEAGSAGSANALRDRRDAVLKRMAELVDVQTQEMPGGSINVLVGSQMLVLGTQNRGIGYQRTANGGGELTIQANGALIQPPSGQIGGLMAMRTQMSGVADQLDELAGNLIFELNKIHSAGQGLQGFAQVTATNAVNDAAAVLNTDAAGLKFDPTNGSFVVHIRQKTGGLMASELVQVDLDGLNGDDTTLESLQAALNMISGISATISAGKLTIQADSSDTEIVFSQDSSGVLGALGINAFFTGATASDMAVDANIKAAPALLAVAQNGEPTDNQAALAIVKLESKSLTGLGEVSIQDRYAAMVNGIAVSTAGARNTAEAAQAIKDTLLTQREALSGVSLDEEAINLIKEQRAFQGAARIIAAVDEMIKTLMQLV
jgi:flagellar hook-associated protein 1 FlgK